MESCRWFRSPCKRSVGSGGDTLPVEVELLSLSRRSITLINTQLIHQFVFRHADAVNLVPFRAGITLFSTIVLAIESAQLYLVTSCEEPKQAWDVLKKHFERETLANKLFLKKQYFRSEMKEGTSVDQHLKHMKDITDKLAAIGAPISGFTSV